MAAKEGERERERERERGREGGREGGRESERECKRERQRKRQTERDGGIESSRLSGTNPRSGALRREARLTQRSRRRRKQGAERAE